jgi:hypothetical protein
MIRQTKVSLRGWDYPHLSNRTEERGFGPDWVAAWSDFWGHLEYWRFYQSGQFLHLFGVREKVEAQWHQKLKAVTRSHLSHSQNIDWDSVPGFIDTTNLLYCVTEIFEFATRLSQKGVYDSGLTISIAIKGIRNFVLTTDWDRGWFHYYAAHEDVLGHSWTVTAEELVADSASYSLKAVEWFLERFGWLDPAMGVLRRDQQAFLSGRR